MTGLLTYVTVISSIMSYFTKRSLNEGNIIDQLLAYMHNYLVELRSKGIWNTDTYAEVSNYVFPKLTLRENPF